MSNSVVRNNGVDYWFTWFIEECEQSNLFGITYDNLGRLTSTVDDRTPYCVGTHIFLVDVPYFRATGNHRICGPYEVFAMDDNLPQDAEPIHKDDDNNIIVFKEAHPENRPWKDRRHVRKIAGRQFPFHQLADKYNFFPYRFGIRRAHNFRQPCEIVRHQNNVNCWLC